MYCSAPTLREVCSPSTELYPSRFERMINSIDTYIASRSLAATRLYATSGRADFPDSPEGGGIHLPSSPIGKHFTSQ